MDCVIVRAAMVGEAPAIARIHVDSWVATYAGVSPPQMFDAFPLQRREQVWSKEAARGADATQRRALLVAVQDGRVLGFANIGPYRVQPSDDPTSGTDGELFALYLDPSLQRRGLGRLLWAAATQHLRAMSFKALRLWVVDGNPAEAFYRAMGAHPVGSASFDSHGVSLREICYRATLTVSSLSLDRLRTARRATWGSDSDQIWRLQHALQRRSTSASHTIRRPLVQLSEFAVLRILGRW